MSARTSVTIPETPELWDPLPTTSLSDPMAEEAQDSTHSRVVYKERRTIARADHAVAGEDPRTNRSSSPVTGDSAWAAGAPIEDGVGRAVSQWAMDRGQIEENRFRCFPNQRKRVPHFVSGDGELVAEGWLGFSFPGQAEQRGAQAFRRTGGREDAGVKDRSRQTVRETSSSVTTHSTFCDQCEVRRSPIFKQVKASLPSAQIWSAWGANEDLNSVRRDTTVLGRVEGCFCNSTDDRGQPGYPPPPGGNFTQTGVGTCLACPAGRTFPVCGSMRNVTIVSVSWSAATMRAGELLRPKKRDVGRL